MDLTSGVSVKKPKEKVDSIIFIPAKFIGYREDGNVLLKCLQGDVTVNRAFEPKHFKNIENINLLFITVMTGDNVMKISIMDGNEFIGYFHTKWKILLD